MDELGYNEQAEGDAGGWGGDTGYPATDEQSWAGDGYAGGDQQAYAGYDQQGYDQQGYDQQAYAMGGQQAAGGGLEDEDGEWTCKATLLADETDAA